MSLGKTRETAEYAGESSQRLEDVNELPSLPVTRETLNDVENIADGVFSPLKGFMGSSDLGSVLGEMRLENGEPWSIPMLLPVDPGFLAKEGEKIALVRGGETIATMELEERYSFPKEEIASKTFGTIDPNHPGVKQVLEGEGTFLAGKINLLNRTKNEFEQYSLNPSQTRELFKQKGWKTVVGFQTRNIPHLGHEYVQKAALTLVDGLFINPVIGKKKAGDFRDELILEAYEALMMNYYPDSRATMGILKTRMRYAGPKEAIFHAIIRKNFGCTHFIVGRDHAGVGSYYKPFDAHDIFSEVPDLGITPLFFRSFFKCGKCGGIVNEKICPHSGEHISNFSGTDLRAALKEGKNPEEMLRNEVFDVINKYDKPFVE